MPAPLFKRFAPPTLATAKQSSPPAATPKSKKKSKTTEVVAAPAEAQEDVVMEDVPAETPRSSKKSKKRKSEVIEEQDEKNEEVSKKHKAVFSKFEKASKLAEARKDQDETEDDIEQPEEELHDLKPMPQPAPVPEPEFAPTFSTLPSWLAQPIIVEAAKTTPFEELGTQPYYVKRLEKLGFTNALAVQTALLPMLHNGFEQHLGDICVSAKTGSGKTMAYLLPIIEALKDQAAPMLSAVVVVPSRQLVNQALQVAEELCAGTKIKVGTALGNIPLATEQKELVKLRAQYNPAKAKQLHAKASQQLETGFVERSGMLEDLMSMPRDHIPRYDSGVDILICTPGRLVEHIEHTTGFLLKSVRWLVIDEADQLLNQNFQGWASVLMNALYSDTPPEFMNAQERLRERENGSIWSVALPARRQLTKIVLSATMEKDLTKLGTLKLRRPKLVVVQGESVQDQPLQSEENVFELPSTLDEYAAPVNDGANKPLHLLHALLNYVFAGIKSFSNQESSDSDSADSDSSSEDESEAEGHVSIASHISRVLIFTKSTESASRLSHLLSELEPSFKKYMKTMTRASTADAARKLLKSFNTGDVKILIASDAASRGLDIPSITHVINYDMPTSITSYVHRVGRTARAGKPGQALTLFSKTEAAWFWKQIAAGDNVRRGDKKVIRMDWKERDVTGDGRKKVYRAALKQLEGAVKGSTDTAE
ncbi:P-loop containing nucleoside triphosphate hydrolase protein [Macroventuria anomochaeta]|uniref:P-loop containing nucleoside triphosphate hydrolase protein n=1 Tax=Macroventuria anomochaeta TaxID=301207 RepID=A0ACB6RI48_9PLEO|nr:P-loop containing nucleoside triphosphate hydrolase protein [Macroventuria anomochaeta]KAF2621666.1 P-loop containing nucleoside triphosphate hydrolase protein [Macroventuria anomochaeta]